MSPDPKDPKKKLKIEFTESTVVDALETYVTRIQNCLAEMLDQPGINGAFVSDLSCIADFLDDRQETGESVLHPLHRGIKNSGKMIKVVTCDTPINREIVAKLEIALGVPVEIYDYVYDVALRLKKLDD